MRLFFVIASINHEKALLTQASIRIFFKNTEFFMGYLLQNVRVLERISDIKRNGMHL